MIYKHFLTVAAGLMLTATVQAKPFYAVKADTLKKDTTVTDTTKVEKEDVKSMVKKEPKETEYQKIIKKGGTVSDGLFRVRHIEDKYYFEVPDSMLGRYILCVTRFTAVPQNFGQFAGEEITHSTIYFEKRDTSQIMIRQYVLSHLADNGDNISRTLEQSTVDPIVQAFKVIGQNEEKDASLIEVTSLFNSDNNLMSFSNTDKTTLKVGGLMKDRTFIDTIKVFPTNIEVATTRTYGSSPARSEASRTGTITMAFNTSMVLLPKDPMRKRLWDDRVGYFVNNFVRFSDDQHKTEHESIISRYRLVPKNKKKYLRGELTEPEKQIVYYIDPATPKKWIPYLIQGINDWNVAFEAAGFKNAITAKVLPEDDPNVSLEDARYSVLRYLPSETENAYGPRIVDPRSGEIIEAHICWFHNVMNLLTKWYMVQCGAIDKRAQTMHFDDKLMGELIRFVSSHEVGHSLGLRHNMGASFATPVEKLRDKAWVEKNGHTASIMDYARFNYVAQPEDNISPEGLFPRINDYDKWAIKWGYQWRPEFKDEYEEKEKLKTETTNILKGNPRLWFGGEGRNEDPRAQTED
nr:zinc-dependent metalloprotease [Prevotella sp.]